MTMRRCWFGLMAAMLLIGGAAGAQAQSSCVGLRGFETSVRLVNTCNVDLNVAACCEGEGAIGSCQGNQFEELSLPAHTNKSVGRCSGYVNWTYCESPEVLSGLSWNESSGFRGRCVTASETAMPAGETRVLACKHASGTRGVYQNEFVGTAGKRCLYNMDGAPFWLEISEAEACPVAVQCE